MDLEGYQKKKEDIKLGGRLVGKIWGEWRGKIEVDMITLLNTHMTFVKNKKFKKK